MRNKFSVFIEKLFELNYLKNRIGNYWLIELISHWWKTVQSKRGSKCFYKHLDYFYKIETISYSAYFTLFNDRRVNWIGSIQYFEPVLLLNSYNLMTQ